jgi:serine/threonine protein kinase
LGSRIATCDQRLVLRAFHERNYSSVVLTEVLPLTLIQNILVASLSPLLIKIGDFGISKRVQNNDTALRTSCGAMDYAAPEIYIHRHPEYTNAVDIWSLGCVAHKILTGRTPFTNPDLWKYVYGSTEFPVQHLATKRISESGVEFIQCLMEKDPGTRLSAEQARKAAWLNVVEEA